MKLKKLASNVCAIIIFFLSLTTQGSNICDPKAKPKVDDLGKINEQLTDALNDANTYFSKACHFDNEHQQNLNAVVVDALARDPRQKYFPNRIPFQDKNKNLTQDFLKKVVQRVKARHKFNLDLATKMKNCTEEATPSINCAAINNWLSNDLPGIVSVARANLAVAYPTTSPSFFASEYQITHINQDLNPEKTFKAVPWTPLNSDETRNANKYLKDVRATISERVMKDYSDLSPRERLDIRRQDLLTIRHTHYMIYMSYMGINPVLQQIKSPNPSRSEINQASRNVLKSLNEEKDFLDEMEVVINKPISIGRTGTKTLDDKVLDLMNYRTEVEEVLLEDPKYCGLGVALNRVKGSQETTKLLATLPIMAASFFVPPLAGLAIAGLTSTYFIYNAQEKANESRSRETARIQREGLTDLNSLLETQNSDVVRQQLQNDVTRVYRTNLQAVQNDVADRNTAVITAPLILASPLALKSVSNYASRMVQAFKTAP